MLIKKKMCLPHSLVERSRKLFVCLFVGSSSACIVIFVFDVDVTN